jgi:hypothetical protein
MVCKPLLIVTQRYTWFEDLMTEIEPTRVPPLRAVQDGVK